MTKNSFIHSFILTISIAPLQVLYHSEALPTTARILYRSFTPKRTGNCRQRTCPRSLRDGQSGSRTHDPPVESNRLNQCAITSNREQWQADFFGSKPCFVLAQIYEVTWSTT